MLIVPLFQSLLSDLKYEIEFLNLWGIHLFLLMFMEELLEQLARRNSCSY